MERVCFFLPIKAVDNFSAKNAYTNHNGCNLNWLHLFWASPSGGSGWELRARAPLQGELARR